MKIFHLVLFTLLISITSAMAQVKPGDQAPDIKLKNPEGKTISLSQFKGKVVLVDFWASWCAPCRKANPGLVSLYTELHPSGLEMISVSLDTKKEYWLKAIKADKLTWTQLSDLKGWDAKPALDYGVEALPSSFLLDKNGKVIALNLEGAELKQMVNKLLKQ